MLTVLLTVLSTVLLQLTKAPEQYPDARSQPHVQVALRRKAAGKAAVMPVSGARRYCR